MKKIEQPLRKGKHPKSIQKSEPFLKDVTEPSEPKLATDQNKYVQESQTRKSVEKNEPFVKTGTLKSEDRSLKNVFKEFSDIVLKNRDLFDRKTEWLTLTKLLDEKKFSKMGLKEIAENLENAVNIISKEFKQMNKEMPTEIYNLSIRVSDLLIRDSKRGENLSKSLNALIESLEKDKDFRNSLGKNYGKIGLSSWSKDNQNFQTYVDKGLDIEVRSKEIRNQAREMLDFIDKGLIQSGKATGSHAEGDFEILDEELSKNYYKALNAYYEFNK